ncbi:MAG: LysR family transcriptional regulator [bacterium]
MSRLGQIDANLLVALDVLLEERHVTRAAQRLGVTQSAMSQTLQRLRDAFGDPLLVRSGRQMVPTPRGEAIGPGLRAALRGLDSVLSGAEGFEPGSARRTFRIACLDAYSANLVPRLVARLAEAGPGLDVDVVALDVDAIWDQLRARAVELAIIGPWARPADVEGAPLLRERLVGMVRAGHPLLGGPIDAAAYVRWPHAVTRISGRGSHPIDERLAALGLSRRVVARTPYFLAAPALVVASDVVVTVPRSAARAFAARWPVVLFDPPIGAPIEYAVSMAWPNHLAADAGHRWLRGEVAAIGEALRAWVEAG